MNSLHLLRKAKLGPPPSKREALSHDHICLDAVGEGLAPPETNNSSRMNSLNFRGVDKCEHLCYNKNRTGVLVEPKGTGGDTDVLGDPIKLTREFAKSFCIFEAMDAAGYKGSGRIYDAVRDIEAHAHILRSEIICGNCDDPQNDKRLQRIIGEYERIAFAGEADGIRTADKLKALDLYRVLSETESDTGGGNLIINYDYGEMNDGK